MEKNAPHQKFSTPEQKKQTESVCLELLCLHDRNKLAEGQGRACKQHWINAEDGFIPAGCTFHSHLVRVSDKTRAEQLGVSLRPASEQSTNPAVCVKQPGLFIKHSTNQRGEGSSAHLLERRRKTTTTRRENVSILKLEPGGEETRFLPAGGWPAFSKEASFAPGLLNCCTILWSFRSSSGKTTQLVCERPLACF